MKSIRAHAASPAIGGDRGHGESQIMPHISNRSADTTSDSGLKGRRNTAPEGEGDICRNAPKSAVNAELSGLSAEMSPIDSSLRSIQPQMENVNTAASPLRDRDSTRKTRGVSITSSLGHSVESTQHQISSSAAESAMNSKGNSTPGPWRVDMSIIDPGTDIRCTCCQPGTMLAQVVGHGDHRTQKDANARLIAAAPALLEALRDLVGVAWPNDQEDSRTNRAIQRARAALALVEGGES